MKNREGVLLYYEQACLNFFSALQNIWEPDELEKKPNSIDTEIQTEVFGCIHVKERRKPKKSKKKSHKDLNSMFSKF